MTRTDIHRPSAIDPTQYQYVACECRKIEGIGDAQHNGAKLIAIDQATGISFRPAKDAIMPDGFDGYFFIYTRGWFTAEQNIRDQFPSALITPLA